MCADVYSKTGNINLTPNERYDIVLS